MLAAGVSIVANWVQRVVSFDWHCIYVAWRYNRFLDKIKPLGRQPLYSHNALTYELSRRTWVLDGAYLPLRNENPSRFKRLGTRITDYVTHRYQHG